MRARWIVLGAVLGLPPLVLGGVVLGLRSEAGQAWAVRRVVDLIQPADGTLTVASVRTDLWSTLRIEGISLRDRSGKELAGADVLDADFSLRELLHRRVRVLRLTGEGLRGDITMDDRGIDISRVWGPPSTAPSTPWTGLGIDLVLERIDLRASALRLRLDDRDFALGDVALDLGLSFLGDTIRVDGLMLTAASTTPELGDLGVVGDLWYGPGAMVVRSAELVLGPHHASLDGSLGAAGDLGIQLQTLHVEPDALPGSLPFHGAVDTVGTIRGTPETPEVVLRVDTQGGTVDVDAAIDLEAERPAWRARVDTFGFDLHAVVDDVPEVLGDLSVDAAGEGLGWPDDLDGHAEITGDLARAGPAGSATFHGVVELADGIAWAYGLTAATPTGALSADATADLLARVGQATVHALDVDLRDLRRFGARGLGGTARIQGGLDADWSTADPDLSFDGTVAGQGLRYQSSARARSLRGPIAVHWVGHSGTWSTELRGQGLGASTATLDRLRVSARGTADQRGAVRLTAHARGDRLGAGPAFVSTLDAHAQLARSRSGYLQSDVLFDTGALNADRIRGDRASGRLSIAGDTLAAGVDVFDVERTVLGVDATGDTATGHYELPRFLFSPDTTQTWTGTGTQSVTVADDGVDDLRVLIESEAASIGATGSVHRRGETDLDVTVVDLPLQLLKTLDPGLEGYAGTVGIQATARGGWNDMQVTVDGTGAGITVPGAVRDLDTTVKVAGNGRTLDVAATAASDDVSLAALDGSVPFSLDLDHPGPLLRDPIDLTLHVAPGTSEGWNRVLDGQRIPEVRGGGTLTVGGTPLDPEVRVVASVELPPEARETDWLGIDLDASTHAHALQLDALLHRGAEEMASLRGGATVALDAVSRMLLDHGPALELSKPNTWLHDLDLTLTPTSLHLESLADFAPIPDGVTGAIEGAVHARGSPIAPALDGELHLVDGKLDDLAVTQGDLTFSPAAGGYDLALAVGFGSDGDLTVGGFVPVDLASTRDLAAQLALPGLDMKVGGRGLPLQAVSALWPDLEEASGDLLLAGTVSGSLSTPVANLTASTKDAAFRLATTGVAYDEVRFSLAVDPSQIRLDDLHARTSTTGALPERGTVDGSAHAALTGTTIGDWKGAIKLNRTVISALDDLRLRAESGTVTLSGRPPNITVGGTMKVEEARLQVDSRFFEGKTALTLPPWLRVHRAGKTVAAAAEAAPPSQVPTWLKLDFDLDLARQAFISAELPLDASLGNVLGAFATITVDTQTDGKLRIVGKDGALSLVGQVLPIRGTTTIFGKPFAIRDDSTVSFTGADYAAPVLDLHAEYDTRAYGVVEARITGVPDALKVELSSDDYPSQDDVISLLLVGKPASELTAGEGASDGATGAALSMLLNTLGQQGGKAAAAVIAPDLLVVGDQTARVGKRVGRGIFVVVDWDNTADDRTDSYLMLTVEIALGGAWQAEFVHGTAGEDSIAVNWQKRY